MPRNGAASLGRAAAGLARRGSRCPLPPKPDDAARPRAQPPLVAGHRGHPAEAHANTRASVEAVRRAGTDAI